MTESNPEKTRWWIRLFAHPYWMTAAAVLLLLTAILLPYAWRFYRTQQLVRAIEANGGRVGYEAFGPEWIYSNFDSTWTRFLAVPTVVELRGEKLDESEFKTVLVPLNELHGLKWLLIYNSSISKTAFAQLEHFEDLEGLLISDDLVDDDALIPIGSLSNLKALVLSHTQITDDGLQHLYGLKNLSHLSVENTGVTEQGLEKLQQRLPSLEISDD